MSYTDLVVKGKTMLMGKEIPVVSGGFGENEKCMLARDIAVVHGNETKRINELINTHIEQFEFGVDLVDLKQVASDDLLLKLGLTKMQVGNSKNIYLLSQRGYIKLVAMMDNKNVTKWEVMGKLIDEYFTLKEIVQQLTPLQQQAIILLDDRASNVERIEAIKQVERLGRGTVCNEKIINYKQIEYMIMDILFREECIQYMSTSDIRETFKDTLAFLDYVIFKRFPVKGSRPGRMALESVATMTPTKKFKEKFTDYGLASVRTIDDTRGKVEIKFTEFIKEWIESDEFRDVFTSLASKYIPQEENEEE